MSIMRYSSEFRDRAIRLLANNREENLSEIKALTGVVERVWTSPWSRCAAGWLRSMSALADPGESGELRELRRENAG